MKLHFYILFLFCLLGCSKDKNTREDPILDNEMYFPPNNSDIWETTSLDQLKWNATAAEDFYAFLSQNGTRGFIILKNGKIVVEKYWGNQITNDEPFDKNSTWYWASAGKTLMAFLIGIAQEKGVININNKVSNYLGKNWSESPLEKENLILVKHQLTMTTGLDYGVSNPDCTEKMCLQYKSDAGSSWFYHNAPYTLLEQVISNASNQTLNKFTVQNVGSLIGINGTWLPLGFNNLYWSTARDAARFGLLMLNEGKWDNIEIMNDKAYFNAMINSSQSLNPSYGFLTWLNGKSSIILPGKTTTFNVSLSSNAPADLHAAMGKNGQFIDVIPSENMVVIRMGQAPDDSFVSAIFHNEMWEKINSIIK